MKENFERAAIVFLVLLSSCSSLTGKRDFESSDITIQYSVTEKGKAAEISNDFKKARNSIQEQLGINLSPPAEIIFAKDREEFDKLVQTFLGYSFHKAPSRKSLVAVTGHGKMVFLSPSVYETQSSFVYSPETLRQLIHHESVHLFHAYLNSRSDDAPKYWIEGLPWFLAGQYQSESSWKPVFDTIKSGAIPSLSDLKNDERLSYGWGWTIAQFILGKYGKEAVVKELRLGNRTNFFSLLGESQMTFEEKWQNFLKTDLHPPR